MLALFSCGNSQRALLGEKDILNNDKKEITQKESAERAGSPDEFLPYFSEETIHLYWCKKAGVDLSNINTKWESLHHENNFNTFRTLLKRLHCLADYIEATQVVEVIQSVIDSPAIGKLIFDASRDADEDCDHRPLSIFKTVQGLARFGKLENAGASQKELLTLAIGIAKLSLLDQATLEALSWRDNHHADWGSGYEASEALEYQLALRKALGKKLSLPFTDEVEFRSPRSIRLTSLDEFYALQYINKHTQNIDCLVEVLVSQPIWRQYMEKVCKTRKEAIDNLYVGRMNQWGEKNKSGTYLDEMSKLKLQRDQNVEELLKSETKKIYSQPESTLLKELKESDGFCQIF